MDITEILRARLTALLDERSAAQAELDTILETVATEKRDDLNDDENTQFAEIRGHIQTADTSIDETKQRLTQVEESRASSAKADELRAKLGTHPDTTSADKGGARVEDAPTYHKRSEHSFFADAFRAQFQGDYEARDRVALAQRQLRAGYEQRAVTTSSFGGLIVPMYLIDEFAPIARAGRPFANAIRSLPLPETGVSAIIPRGTTGEVASTTAENAAWSTQDYAETDLSIVVNLITSQQDMSRASFMRGGGLDALIFGDMMSAYATALDAQLISGTGTAPQHRGVLNVSGINSVVYTDASPTVPELWPKIADAIQRVNSNRFMPASLIVMHPTRWGWLTAALDTANRPLVEMLANNAMNTMSIGTAAEYGQVVGQVMGLPVVTDANIPTNLGAGTNEDRILVLRAFDVLLWEEAGGPMQFTFEQVVGPEKVRLALGEFSMFTAARYPTAISVISGTGLTPPTF